MSWYRTYRPTSISGLHLQHVREELETLLKQGSFPHALLFTGPRGAGKTSAARIIARVLNDPRNADAVDQLFFKEKKQKSENSTLLDVEKNAAPDETFLFNVHELDAASNRRIDDIRQLKEQLYLSPAVGKIAVYILDEAHMLTTEAANALLKMLEEPPAHVVFILATTASDQLPETILSLCRVIQFTKATPEELTAALTPILETEKIAFTADALDPVISIADGSFRDAVKLLESVAAGEKKLTEEGVRSKLKLQPQQVLLELLQAIMTKKEKEVVGFFGEQRLKGNDSTVFFQQLMQFLHKIMVQGVLTPQAELLLQPKVALFFLQQFITCQTQSDGPIPFLSLELKALEIIQKAKEKKGAAPTGESTLSSPPKASEKPASPERSAFPTLKNSDVIEQSRPVGLTPIASLDADVIANVVPISTGKSKDLLEQWEIFLQKVSQKNSSIGAFLRSARPIAKDEDITEIQVFYRFHHDQLKEPKFLRMLQDCCIELLGGTVQFEFKVVLLDTVSSAPQEASNDGSRQLVDLAKEALL